MLNKNFKKAVSAVSAAAMLFSLAAPAVMADTDAEIIDEIVESEDLVEGTAELSAYNELSESDAHAEIGTAVDFNDLDTGTFFYITNASKSGIVYEGVECFKMYMGSRNDANSAVNIGISKSGVGGSNALVMNAGGYSSANRGPRIQLVTPDTSENYTVSFKAKVTGSEYIRINDDTSGNDGETLTGVGTDGFADVLIMMVDGVRTILVNRTKVMEKQTASLPTIWTSGANSNASVIIDDYAINAFTDLDALMFAADEIKLSDPDNSIYEVEDGYVFVSDFELPKTAGGYAVEWTAQEYASGWKETADITIDGTTATPVNASSAKEYRLLAKLAKGEAEYTKEFYLMYSEAQDVVDNIVPKFDPFNGNYTVTEDKELPTTFDVAKVSWESADDKLVHITDDGIMTVYPKEPTTVKVTATLSLADASVTKEFTLDLSQYYAAAVANLDKEFENVVLHPATTGGEKMASIALSDSDTALISYDVAFPAYGSTTDYDVEWKSSDINYLSNSGVIGIYDKDAHKVTLTRTVTFVKNGEDVISKSQDYKVNVQFDPEAMEDSIEETADAYAELVRVEKAEAARVKYAKTKSSDVESDDYKKAYDSNAAQEEYDKAYALKENIDAAENAKKAALDFLLYRNQTRGDAAYEKNFEDIPSWADDDFTVNTEGYFGSTISWTSTDDSIRVSGKSAKVTQKTSDRTATLKASVMAGTSLLTDIYSTDVTVDAKSGSSKSSSGGGSSSSGGGNSYRGSLGTAAYVAAPTAAPVAPNASVVNGDTVNIQSKFKDLLDVAWAAEAIEALAEKGIVSGKDDTRFAPNDNITRAELSKIIAGAFGIDTGAAASFSDTASDAWYAPFVGACAAAGIVTGYEDGTFRPDNLVSRQEMAVMIKRAADFAGTAITAQNAKTDFTDKAAIADYAAEAIETLQMAGIINGMEDGSFAPNATATRAQAAKILYNFAK